MSPDAATTSSEGSPPLLIACRRSFPVGFNRVVFILLVLLVSLVPIVVFAFMMMVDNRTGWSANCHCHSCVLWSCDHDEQSTISTVGIRPTLVEYRADITDSQKSTLVL